MGLFLYFQFFCLFVYMFVLMPLLHCLDCCYFIVSFEIAMCTFYFVLFLGWLFEVSCYSIYILESACQLLQAGILQGLHQNIFLNILEIFFFNVSKPKGFIMKSSLHQTTSSYSQFILYSRNRNCI